jgi:ELWxxDGT repeat protein
MRALFIIIFSLFISAGYSQNSLLTQVKSSTQSSYPRYGVDVNGVYYFVAGMANSSDYGFWKSDGTPGGTTKIITATGIRPQPSIRDKACIIPFGNKVLLIASNYYNNLNFELWITDGTPAGTFLLKEINPNTKSDIKNIKVVSIKGALKAFFSANNGTVGEELWVTDGTTDGTKLVKDIYQGIWHSLPSDFVQLQDKVLFSAIEPAHGRELWITDGTEAGTELVKDINPGPGNSFVANSKIVVNGYGAYINLNDGSVLNSTVLIQTGGTYNSTYSMGNSFLNPDNLTLFDGRVYFTTSSNFSGNLFYLGDNVMPTKVNNSFTYYGWTAENLTVSNNKLYLLINNTGTGQTDLGVIESPVDAEIAHLISVTGAGIDPFPVNPEKRKLIPVANGNIYFFTGQQSSETRLWSSNGTQQGTKAVINLWNGDYSYVRTFNNKLFFITNSDNGEYKCYVTDNGSDAVVVKDLTPALNIDNAYPLAQSGDWFYFSAYNPATGYELYKSDGETNNFIKDIDVTYKSNDYNFSKTVANSNGLFFVADDGKNGLELWKTNGKQTGTSLFADLNPYPMPEKTTAEEDAFEYYNYSSKFWDLYEFNDQIYIMTFTGVWVTDGVNAPLELYSSPRLNQLASSNKFEAANGHVYFNVINELWQTGGSPESTVQVGVVDNTRPKDSYSIRGLRAIDNKLYFLGYSTQYGDEVYQYSDGSISLIKDVIPGQNTYIYSSESEVVGNSFYYTKYTSTDGCKLYITDGTAVNTRLLHSFGTAGACPSYLTNFKDSLLVFQAYDNENGYELWKSDGTEAGTQLVNDIYPGTNSGSPFNYGNRLKYIVFEDNVYFLASTPSNGRKLFKSDLTPEGTIPLTDISNIYAYSGQGGVYFADGGSDSEPAKIESTPASKRVLANIVPNGHSLPQYFVGHNGLIFMRITLPNGAHQIHVFKDCKNNAVLAGDMNYLYTQVYDTIKSSNKIKTDQSYQLLAGKSIELTPGFVADSNSVFEAKIEACVYSTAAN